ncbi:MAG: prephenate dehydratase [Thermoleophilaceae bacterium]|jgi:prephenate dehydratase|nr:prephenate dehydratase [Thermoleophilaceae bacterium]
MRVGFLGPAGTFTEEALRASAPSPVEEMPYATVREAVMAVQHGHADRAVVPIENSLEGSVTATLDALAGDAGDVRIVLDVVRPIIHCLIGRTGTRLEQVRRVVSHPQAIAQCEGFLRARLAAAEVTPATSTAEAVRAVAGSAEPWAALGSRLAAALYGCPVLAEGVEDRPGNETRFVWLAPVADARVPDATKTSLVFWGPGDRTPGALVGVLHELSDRGINLTKIESRPRRVGLGHYMFFLDLDGGEHDPPVAAALEALARRVESLRVLGSYPSAGAA